MCFHFILACCYSCWYSKRLVLQPLWCAPADSPCFNNVYHLARSNKTQLTWKLIGNSVWWETHCCFCLFKISMASPLLPWGRWPSLGCLPTAMLLSSICKNARKAISLDPFQQSADWTAWAALWWGRDKESGLIKLQNTLFFLLYFLSHVLLFTSAVFTLVPAPLVSSGTTTRQEWNGVWGCRPFYDG